ncbi:hypothetical protein BOSP111201_24530 [Bordetella sputigena]
MRQAPFLAAHPPRGTDILKPSVVLTNPVGNGPSKFKEWVRGDHVELNLMLDIQCDHGVAYLMIAHDISIGRAFVHRVVAMCQREWVENGSAEQVLTEPRHPYTRRLVAAVPALARAVAPPRCACVFLRGPA